MLRPYEHSNPMNDQTKTALENKLLAMADDELILAHRNSEWIGHAPILEEDIAIANIAQDELGHATVWYGLYETLTRRDPDELVFFRDATDYRNTQFVELPKGDWAFTILRQFLFDAYELVLLRELQTSSYQPLANAVNKIKNEEIYHFRHTQTWVTRLGLGTAESHRRLQNALNEMWPYVYQLFRPLPTELPLIDANIVPHPDDICLAWEELVLPHLTSANLAVPAEPYVQADRTQHTPNLTYLLTDMQKVARYDPEAEW